ncbi:MAG: AEC family transporter [Endomicrobium sp.]|jgi:predicted permease|nr:AEC family transporter [Endomicrobium sp.]
MFDNLISFFLLAGLGVFFKWKKSGDIDPDMARYVINTIVIKFFLPALCFKVIATSQIDINTVLIPVTAISTILLSLTISFIVYTIFEKFIPLHKKEKGALILGSAFGNVTFLGLLFLTGLYGKSVAKYVLFYDLLATTPLLWLVGTIIACYYGRGEKLTVKDGLKTILQMPPMWALVIGFIVNFSSIILPNFFLKTLDLIAMPIVPLMLFSVGLALPMPKIKHILITIPALIIKLCVAPLLSFAIVSFFGMDGLALKSAIMEAAMPTMVLTLVIASHHKLDHNLSAFIILFTAASAFVTLPLTCLLIRNLT